MPTQQAFERGVVRYLVVPKPGGAARLGQRPPLQRIAHDQPRAGSQRKAHTSV